MYMLDEHHMELQACGFLNHPSSSVCEQLESDLESGLLACHMARIGLWVWHTVSPQEGLTLKQSWILNPASSIPEPLLPNYDE